MLEEIILVVDDNPTNLKLLSFLLASKGYAVRTALSAEEAMEMLASFRPRLILMDLDLGAGMDGMEFTRRLKATPEGRDIVIIAVTAFAMKGDEEKARQAGFDDYVTKPIDTRALPTLIARHFVAPAEKSR